MSSKSTLRGKTGVSRVYSYNNWALRSFFLKQSSQGLMRMEKKGCFSFIFKSTSIFHIFTSFLSTCAHVEAKGREGWNDLREQLWRISVFKRGTHNVQNTRSGGPWDLHRLLALDSNTEPDKISLISRRLCTKHSSWIAFETRHMWYQWYKVVLLLFFLKGR